MALITRVSRLFKADMHAVLDQIEEPISLLRQSIREMEDALGDQLEHIKRLELERRAVEQRASEQEAVPVELDGKLDLCFANGNEELAKKLTRRKLQATRLATHLRQRLQTLTETLDSQHASYAENLERLEAMRQKADCLAESKGVPETERVDLETELSVHDDEVEIAFLEEQQRRTKS